MSDLTRKSRIVSLRVSPQEYDVLKSLYRSHGARSVSDFARLAMHRVLASSLSRPDGLERKLDELSGRLLLLDGEVARLRSRVEPD